MKKRYAFLSKFITIIIPCKNEGKNLQIILPYLKKLYPYAEVLIVDGHSIDNTKKICYLNKCRYYLEYLSPNFMWRRGGGKGNALRQGAKLATKNIIVFFDADCSHDPNDIAKLVYPIINKDYLHVSGSRMLGGSKELFNSLGHIIRLLGSLIINILISLKYNYRITDAQNGLRAFDRNFFISLKTKSIHTTIEQELVCLTLAKNKPILEVPCHEHERLYGISKINIFKHGLKYLFLLLKMLFFTKNPRYYFNKTVKLKYQTQWWLKSNNLLK